MILLVSFPGNGYNIPRQPTTDPGETMMLPTIHLNGSSASSLSDSNRAAYDALYAAVNALAAAAPNARDYYPQGEGAFTQAVQEHLARITHLQVVLGELATIEEYLADHI